MFRIYKKLIEIFDLGANSKYSVDLFLAVKKHDEEKSIEMIKNIVNEIGSMNDFKKSKLYTHMKFNESDHMSIGEYEQLVKKSIEKDKTLDFVKDDPRIKLLLQ